MHSFRELRIWQRAMEFVVEVCELSAGFPRSEQFGLTGQNRNYGRGTFTQLGSDLTAF